MVHAISDLITRTFLFAFGSLAGLVAGFVTAMIMVFLIKGTGGYMLIDHEATLMMTTTPLGALIGGLSALSLLQRRAQSA